MNINLNHFKWIVPVVGFGACVGVLVSQNAEKTVPSSYMPVDIHESFTSIMSRMSAAKPEIMRRQTTLLEQRYDLSNRPAQGVTMSRGKALQQGVRVKLPSGFTWEKLAALT